MKYTLERFCSHKSLRHYGVSALSLVFLITACAAPSKPSHVINSKPTVSQIAKGHTVDTDIEKRLRQEYRQWQGTGHRLGGNGSRGIDCSGFVRTVYKGLFNINLPRTTRMQVRHGRSVSFEKLRAGDLVFFRPPSYPRHVGIYLGGSEFVHASKTKGVTISKIDQYYWGKYYWTARRILPTSQYP